MTPQRIQLRRTKGWRLQEVSRALNGLEAVNVSRPSKWGNPFSTSEAEEACFITGRNRAVAVYEAWIDGDERGRDFAGAPPSVALIKRALGGKNLACWCPTALPNGVRCRCHADVLLRLANPENRHG